MRNLKIFFLSLILVGMFVMVQAINLDENIQSLDLEISKPKLLSDNFFYFLKNWLREIKLVFVINPIEKIELRMKFANEKLMEMKKIIQKTTNSEIIKKAVENYQKELEKIKKQSERIKEKARENPMLESFLDKFVHQQILHQKLLQKLEIQVSPEVFEKIKELRERHLEKFQEVILRLEDRKEKIAEKLQKNLDRIKLEKQEKFIERIFGTKEKYLEILKNLKLELIKECQTDADCPQFRCAPRTRCIGIKSKCIEGKCQIVATREAPKRALEESIERLPALECVDICGDGICQKVVCIGVGCPCPEISETCQDCQ